MSDDIPTTSGVYKITCTANEKIYIGSAVNLRNRRRQHFNELRQNKHSNPKLQRAWNKYGEQAFIFEVLELVLPIFLTAREQYWFNKLKPFGRKGFNIAREAGSQLGFNHSPEARERIGRSQIGKKNTPETIEKIRQTQLGRKNTPEAIEKHRQAMLGRKISPEHIEKIRQAKKGKKPSSNAVEAARLTNIGRKRPPEVIEKIRQTKLSRKVKKEA